MFRVKNCVKIMAGRYFFAWKLLVAARSQDERNHLRRHRTASRLSFDPLRDLSDMEFRNRYRLNRAAFLFLCQELERLTNIMKTQQISLQEKVNSLLCVVVYSS